LNAESLASSAVWAGQRTLAKLVQRLYVQKAAASSSTASISQWWITTWLRRQLGVVLQENILFNRSIRENIALAEPGMPIEKIIIAATLASAHEFILDGGYDTIVGERGSSLSGGQRQRIAIARALVTEPRVLIFDEATSALDYESERIIQQNMAQICKGRTELIVAHRLSTVRLADRIVTIDHGRITEDGTRQLVRNGGRFATLYRLQSGIHEVG
jgi:subfamily B ATP-binding cassette protein HlyB/CyaB